MYHFLLIDDDDDDCFLFTEIGKEVSPELKVTCIVACELLTDYLEQATLPNLILMDLNMPRTNGIECIKLLKNNGKWQNVPIITYSTASSEISIRRSYDAGASLYIVKPDSTKALKQIIKSIVDKVANGEIR